MICSATLIVPTRCGEKPKAEEHMTEEEKAAANATEAGKRLARPPSRQPR
jgi:hypothetical protein